MVDISPLLWLWSLGLFFVGIIIVLGILASVFWIWMIIDAAKRMFRNTAEKVVWIVVIIFGGLVGAFIYFLVIRHANPRGLVNR